MVVTEYKYRVIEEIINREKDYISAAKHAVALGINSAQLSRIKKGEIDKVISDANWISIGRRYDISLKNDSKWITAKTPAYNFIYSQLKECQKLSISGVFCDLTDIGKTHTAKQYTIENKNVVYIDCSQVKTKQLLVRKIAKEFGIGQVGRYLEVYDNLIFYLNNSPNPLIILDEAGDLKADAFLELKALWNATERTCGWYMLGADALKYKIEKGKNLFTIGYAEIFRRYGKRYQSVTPRGKEDTERFLRTQFGLVAKANSVNDIQKMYAISDGSLERIRIEVEKSQRQLI